MTLASSNSSASVDDSTPDIVTPRLELIAITRALLCANFARSPEFSQLINADVPAEWPPEGWDTDAFNYVLDKMDRYPNCHGWGRYIAVKASEGGRRILAGTCGATLPIELTDDPEIGYGMLPAYQGCGYATEAATALVSWIFQFPHVRSVNAQTFPHLQPSLRVMEKLGMKFAGPGPGPEEGTVLYRKWRE
jgi:[ribosomal protein S5]-alanine N-acetyltransferase